MDKTVRTCFLALSVWCSLWTNFLNISPMKFCKWKGLEIFLLGSAPEMHLWENEGGWMWQRKNLQCYCKWNLSSAYKDFWSRHSPSELFQAMLMSGHFSPHINQSVAEPCPLERDAAVGKTIPWGQGHCPVRNSAVSPQQWIFAAARGGCLHLKGGFGRPPLHIYSRKHMNLF